MPKTRIKKKTDTTGGFQDLGYTLTEDEITSFNNKVDKVTSTDNAIARFNGTTGAIQNSTVTITDAGKIIAPSFASDATEAGMVFSDNNELNFGSNSNTLYIGYRNKLNTSGSVGIYNFGTSSGSTGMTSGRINAGDIYSNSKKVATETFVTGKIAELVNAAPAELDTLKELAEGITANKDVLETVTEAVGKKVDKVTSTDNAIARFDGTNGAIQNSKVTIDDNGVIYSNNTKVALTSDLTNVVKTTTNNTFTANNIFKNNAFEIRANSVSDDSWIKLTNATDSGYYAFGIRRPYDMYGLQMKIHPDTGNDQYIDILHAGNYTKYAVPKTRTINNQALTSNITLTASNVGAEPAFTKNSAFNKNFGTAAGTVCEGNDSRLSNARTPTAHTHVKSEITNFPTIPTVNNGTLTIQKNGTSVATFTANQSTNAIANITVPTTTSELTNDSGFITSDDLPSGGVTSVVGQTGAVTATQIKSGLLNSVGGFSIGTNADASSGGAIGNTASAVTGGAIGKNSYAESGGAIGEYATTGSGGAVGDYSKSTTGGAVGEFAEATTGFAGGYNSKATASGAVQLGEGTNATTNTLQFREYQLLDANGKIPSDRLNITGGVTSVIGNTGAVTAAQIKTGIQTSPGGFAIGANNPSATTGGAIGKSSKTASGGAVGESATASTSGGAVGYFSNTTAGGAIGGYAQSTTGFAGGYDARATADGAVQLGTGTNATANTLNFRTYKLLNANGYIPFDRLQHIASTHLDDLEFTTIFEGDVGSGAITIEGGKSLCDYRIIFILGANDARNGAEWKMYYGWQFRDMASNTLVNSVVLSTSHTTGGWLIRRDSLTSTTTLTQTEENMRIYAIYGMN